jgi:hypothetical protein
MDVGIEDLSLTIYNVAVTMAGGYLTLNFGGLADPMVLVAIVLVSIGWTLYFKHAMMPRLEGLRGDGAATSGLEPGDGYEE